MSCLVGISLGTEKVPQRTCVTKILPNVRVNFLARFASKPLFYWVMTGNPLELLRKFFGAVRAIFWFCGPFLVPDFGPGKKYLAPPPLPTDIPPAPFLLGTPPPPPSLYFFLKPAAPGHLLERLLPPRPRTEKNKKYPKRLPSMCKFSVP